MKANDLLDMIGNTDDGIVKEAKKRKKPAVARWTKWVAVAACICLAIGIAVSHNSSNVVTDNNHADTAQGHVLETPQKMTVKIVGWAGDGFRVTVIEAEKNTIFPNGAELTIVFNEETVFILSDGSTITFNPEDDSTPISSIVGWPDGSIVHVEFTAYEDYNEGNHYYNRATGSHLELVE